MKNQKMHMESKQFSSQKNPFFKVCSIAAIVLSLVSGLSVGAKADDLQKFSILIMSVVKHTQWINQSSSDKFIISIVGNDDIYEYLKRAYEGKTKDRKAIQIRKYASISEIDVKSHAIFLDSSKSSELESLIANHQDALILTNQKGMGKRGSSINFVPREGKIFFEINRRSLSNANLKVTGELLEMSIPVN